MPLLCAVKVLPCVAKAFICLVLSSFTSRGTAQQSGTLAPTAKPTSNLATLPATPTSTRKPTRKPSPAPTLPPHSPNVQGGPNFLYILADDIGYADISAMPGRTNFNITTPNIDALFSEGMRFTDFYANRECAASRGAIMTGKHQGHATVRTIAKVNSPWLRTADVTFFELLRDLRGYVVSCIGKWHVGGYTGAPAFRYTANAEGAPWNKGCERFFGVENTGWHYPTDSVYRYNKASGLQALKFPTNVNASRERCMSPGNTCVWLTEMNLREALAELDYHKARQDAEAAAGFVPAPFFMYLAWSESHVGSWVRNSVSGNPVPGNSDFTGESWPGYEKDFAAAIHTYHDTYVQQVLEKLDALGLRNDTVVIYTSDNGPYQGYVPVATSAAAPYHGGAFFGSNGPFQGWKLWLTEGGIRIPAAIRWPGKIAAGSVSSEPLALWDLFPTILDIAGVPGAGPADIDGVSFYQAVLQQPAAAPGNNTIVTLPSFVHPPLYWESCSGGTTRPDWTFSRKGTAFQRAIRQGKWKGYQPFLKGTLSTFSLYDLSNDIYETTDVSAAYPLKAQELKALMDSPEIRSSIAGGFNYTPGDDPAAVAAYGTLIA